MSTPNRRDRWKIRVQKDRKLAAETRLFLVATLAPRMKSDGKVSQPRKRLAAESGVSERMVTKYIKAAREAGWLVVVQPGYRTMTAVYQATFPDIKEGTHEFALSRPERGNYKDPLCAGTLEFPHSPEESGNSCVPTTSSSTTRRLRVVGTDRNVTHLPKSPLSRRRVFGFGTNESGRDRRTSCRTQARTVERHRRRPTAAQVETHPSGTQATTPLVCQTQPRRKAHRMKELPILELRTPCDSPGCTFGMTGLWMNLCARCGGSGYLQPGDTPTGADAARIAAGLAPKHGQVAG